MLSLVGGGEVLKSFLWMSEKTNREHLLGLAKARGRNGEEKSQEVKTYNPLYEFLNSCNFVCQALITMIRE